jgi:hypothetical protein
MTVDTGRPVQRPTTLSYHSSRHNLLRHVSHVQVLYVTEGIWGERWPQAMHETGEYWALWVEPPSNFAQVRKRKVPETWPFTLHDINQPLRHRRALTPDDCGGIVLTVEIRRLRRQAHDEKVCQLSTAGRSR